MTHDYRTVGNKDVVDVVVRPGMKYGAATAGEHVIVDKREMQIPASAETLCTPKEYKAVLAQMKKDADDRSRPDPKPVDAVRASIASQLESAGKAAAARRRGDRRFVDPTAPRE